MRAFWKNSAAAAARLRSGRLLVTLDFDGTLAALAKTPGKARLKPQFRSALKTLAGQRGVYVFILSGRELRNVRRLVGLKSLYYGGNHGIEIQGPGFYWRDAAAARRPMQKLAAELRERFPEGTGVLVEDKVFSVGIHYRHIRPRYRVGFLGCMRALAASPGKMRLIRGRRMFEALPSGTSHKGTAAGRLAKELGVSLALAVGDDLTDEDMFRALKPGGITIRVGRAASAARYYLARQAEVLRLLRFISAAREDK
ncbi:MAG: trehalose-phosphatase [Elusimicrobia bacterium CG08_land_8_20_14_0_20_59_10]|nr:MAG: trehalose-phosphatase [Elusimicrobia bacterium CG08_land_8_20_14_0_20_59_10]